jgi:hypothetical protein
LGTILHMKRLVVILVLLFVVAGLRLVQRKPVAHEQAKVIEPIVSNSVAPKADEVTIDPSSERLDLDSKVQIRKDIKSWISSQKLSPKLQNQITNLAISDEFLILNSKDDKAVQKSSKENSQRISCMIKEAKSPKERVLHLISEMRQRTFNSRSRANSYNEFQRKSAQNQLTVDQSESELNLHCKEYSEKIMNITF